MAVNLHTFVDLHDRGLDTAAHILAKGAEHAAATGVTEPEMLDWRVIHDMHLPWRPDRQDRPVPQRPLTG